VAQYDFRIEIGMGGADGYGVIMRAPDGSEEATTMQLPVYRPQLDMLATRLPGAVVASSVLTRDGVFTADQVVRELGTLLFDALLGGGGRAMLAASRNRAASNGERMRLVLQIRPDELARLPWEFMFDSHAEEYVCLASPLIRHPLALKPRLPMPVTPPLRILGMIARPTDQEQLATSEEIGRLEDALAELVHSGLIELAWVAGQTWRDLWDATLHGPWHIFHFIGHGAADPASREGSVALGSPDSTTYNLGADELAMLLSDHFSLRLVVLNACETDDGTSIGPFSSMARTLIMRGCPAVLAMQNQISDHASVELSRTFYTALANLQPVDLAVMQARRAIRLALPGSLEWGTPVLYMRSTDGDLFGPSGGTTSAVTSNAGLASRGNPPAGHASADDPKPLRSRRPAAERRPSTTRKPATTRRAPTRQLRAHPYEVAGIRAPDHVNAVSFNRDGTLLGFACDGRLALVIDRIGRECLRLRHGTGVRAVADVEIDCANGTRLATAAGKMAQIWDVSTGDLLREVSHEDTVRRVAFSPNGRHLATASMDKTARIWDTSTGKQLLEISHDGSVLDVAFSPDGQTIATASGAGTVRLCGAATGIEVRVFNHEGAARAVAFSRRGRLLASGSAHSTVRIWDVASGNEVLKARHQGPVRAVAFNSDGRLLATGSADSTVRIWDVASGSQVLLVQHHGPVRAVAFSSDGLLATGGEDRAVHIWMIFKDGEQP
jgi:hypothetical protein